MNESVVKNGVSQFGISHGLIPDHAGDSGTSKTTIKKIELTPGEGLPVPMCLTRMQDVYAGGPVTGFGTPAGVGQVEHVDLVVEESHAAVVDVVKGLGVEELAARFFALESFVVDEHGDSNGIAAIMRLAEMTGDPLANDKGAHNGIGVGVTLLKTGAGAPATAGAD